MAYNFEGTFVQPLLAQLDNGLIKGADDWADAITKAYINTVKTGLPQGAPSTLPAPGLNPTGPPPPFAIGAAPFNTADTRSQPMYNVIRAYFLAKEISLDKGNIEGLIATVKQLITKIKTRYSQVKSLIEQIKRITDQLKELPKLLADIVAGFVDLIKDQIENVKQIANSFNDFQGNLSPEEFRQIFREELSLIDTLKNFDIPNLAGIRDLALFVSEYGSRSNNLLATASDTELQKKYVKDRLFSIAKEFLSLADGVLDPTRIIGFLSSIAAGRSKANLVLEKVKRFDLFIRFVQPKLKKLEKLKDEKIKEIRDKIQPKLLELQKKLQDKINEFAKKIQTSKAGELYAKAAKSVNDLKKKNEKKIKEIKKKVELGNKALKKTVSLVGKVTTLVEGLKGEFETIKNEILEYQKTVTERIQQTGEAFASLRAPDVPPAPSTPSFNAEQLDASTLGFLEREIAKVKNYMSSIGLDQFGELGALVITQTKCDIQTFKNFFERRGNTIERYVGQITYLEKDLRDVIAIIKEFVTNKKDTKIVEKTAVGQWLTDRVKSLKDLFQLLVKWLDPRVKKIEKWIGKQIDKLKKFLQEKLTKFANELKIFAINLTPLKSDVQDVKDKAAAAEDKLNKVKDKIAKIKKLIKLGTFIAKMATGSIRLATNLAKGSIKFSENQTNIQNILDGWFGFRMEDKPSSVQKTLMLEKERYKNDFKALLIIETLVVGLVETFKDIANSEFVRDLQGIIESLPDNIPGKRTLQTLVDITKNPPTDFLQLKSIAEQLGAGVLNDVSIATNLINLEKKYLLRSREVITKLCEIKRLEGTKAEKFLIKLGETLKKNQSFLAIAFQWLLEQIKLFFSFVYNKIIKKAVEPIKKFILKKKEKVEEQAKIELEKIKEKNVNLDAPIMSFAFGLAGRLFWTGATWTGPTGTQPTTFNDGQFTPMKAKSTDGASAMIREMAQGFEAQLAQLQGILLPPPNTGIAPITFTGYK